MPTVNSIGTKIRRIRELRGIRQEDLATRVGVTVRTIAMWELKEQLDREALEKISVGLDLSVDFLLFFDENAFIAMCIKMQIL